MTFDTSKLVWTRAPKAFDIQENRIAITTEPHTDLWQGTYYGFRNDNAPVRQMETEDEFFSFVVKTAFASSHHRCSADGVNFKQMRICHLFEGV